MFLTLEPEVSNLHLYSGSLVKENHIFGGDFGPSCHFFSTDAANWLGSFCAPVRNWGGLLLRRPIDMEKRDLIQRGEANLLDLRSYLFSRQCTLLIFLQRPWEVTHRALELLHNCVQELHLLEVYSSCTITYDVTNALSSFRIYPTFYYTTVHMLILNVDIHIHTIITIWTPFHKAVLAIWGIVWLWEVSDKLTKMPNKVLSVSLSFIQFDWTHLCTVILQFSILHWKHWLTWMCDSTYVQVSVLDGALDCWVFLSCLEVLHRIEGCCDQAQLAANSTHTVGLWVYAIEKVSPVLINFQINLKKFNFKPKLPAI